MCTDEESSELKNTMSELSDQQLLKIVGIDFPDHRKEALDYAKAELMSRGIAFDDSPAKAQSKPKESEERTLTSISRGGKIHSRKLMKDVSLLLLIAFCSFLGALGAICIMCLQVLALVLTAIASHSSYIEAGDRFVFYLHIIIGFAITGVLGAVFFRSLVGSGMITVLRNAMDFALGGIIGGAVIAIPSSADEYIQRVLIGSLISYVIGVMLCWLKARSYRSFNEGDAVRVLRIDDKE